MKTFMAKEGQIERKWYVVDASGMALGRLASQVAAILRGKNKPTFTPNVDTGDHVIVINTGLEKSARVKCGKQSASAGTDDRGTPLPRARALIRLRAGRKIDVVRKTVTCNHCFLLCFLISKLP